MTEPTPSKNEEMHKTWRIPAPPSDSLPKNSWASASGACG